VANGVVYAGASDHHLYAWNVVGCGDGCCPFLASVDTGGDIRSDPAVADGVVCIGSARTYKAYGL